MGAGGDATKELVLGYRLHFGGGEGVYWVVELKKS